MLPNVMDWPRGASLEPPPTAYSAAMYGDGAVL